MKRLKIFATEKELKSIIKIYKSAESTPSYGVTSEQCLSENDFSNIQWKNLRNIINETAFKHGLPRLNCNYGIDLENGEFLRAAGSKIIKETIDND